MPTDFTFWWFVMIAVCLIFGAGWAYGWLSGFNAGKKEHK